MSWRRALAKLRFLFRRGPDDLKEDDLAEEIRAHLAMEETENIAAGMDLEEARHQARRSFGNVRPAAERSRDMWKWTTLETLWMDIAYAFRQITAQSRFCRGRCADFGAWRGSKYGDFFRGECGATTAASLRRSRPAGGCAGN